MTGLFSCSTQKDICLKNGNYDHNTGTYKSVYKIGKIQDSGKALKPEITNNFADTSDNIVTEKMSFKCDGSNALTKAENKAEKKLSFRETHKMERVINKYKKNTDVSEEGKKSEGEENPFGILSFRLAIVAYIFGLIAMAFHNSPSSIYVGALLCLLAGILFAGAAFLTGIFGLRRAHRYSGKHTKGLSVAGLIFGGLFFLVVFILLLVLLAASIHVEAW